jgi:hypothetical protein
MGAGEFCSVFTERLARSAWHTACTSHWFNIMEHPLLLSASASASASASGHRTRQQEGIPSVLLAIRIQSTVPARYFRLGLGLHPLLLRSREIGSPIPYTPDAHEPPNSYSLPKMLLRSPSFGQFHMCAEQARSGTLERRWGDIVRHCQADRRGLWQMEDNLRIRRRQPPGRWFQRGTSLP